MKVLPLPAKPPFWQICGFRMTRAEIAKRLGPPHYVETDGYLTFGGDEDVWAYQLDSGHRVVIQLRVPYQIVMISADPPESLTVMAAFSDVIDQKSIEVYTPPKKLEL